MTLLSGVLYALAFPSTNLSFLAWFALVPLLFLKKPRFAHGFVTGLTANLIIFAWLWKTFDAANIGIPTTLFCWVAMAFVLALYFGVFAFVFRYLPDNIFKPWLAGLVWVLLEVVRSIVLTGFPWAVLAHTQAYHSALLKIVSFGGQELLAFFIVVVNVVIADLLLKRSKATIINSGFLLCLTAVFLFGLRKGNAPLGDARTFKVALLQGNIDQYQKWDSVYEADVRHTYEDLVKEAMESKPDVIIWPESAVPGWFPNDPATLNWVKQVVAKTQTPHIIGAVSSTDGKEYNAAFLLDGNGNIVSQYNKQHMVPFGEYVPFGNIFKRWIPYLGELGTFDAGLIPVLFDVKGVKLAPNICYEAIFPSLIQRSVQHGADIIVNITNDGWFLDTAAPEQHLVANILRAAETGRPVVRAANTGYSVVIDSTGHTRLRSGLLVKGVFILDVPLESHTTIFSLLYSRLCPAK